MSEVNKRSVYLFSDASCQKNKIAIGCYVLLFDLDDDNLDVQQYTIYDTSSTMAELMTIREALKYAHNNIDINNDKIHLFVDCQNFIHLIQDRVLDKNHRNYELYKELVDLVQKCECEIVWVKGHDKKDNLTEKYQKVFRHIDKLSRKLSRMTIK